jgi:hypothetical protein
MEEVPGDVCYKKRSCLDNQKVVATITCLPSNQESWKRVMDEEEWYWWFYC